MKTKSAGVARSRRVPQEAVKPLAIGLLISLGVLYEESLGQFPGATFDERRLAYINDQGHKWEAWFPAAMKQAVFAWLERSSGPAGPDQGNNSRLISEEIGYITDFTGTNGQPECTGQFFWPWKNCWFTGDHPAPIIASRILYQYYQNKKVISDSDAQRIREKLREVATTPGIWCAVANYNFRYLVTGYLYVSRVENVGKVFYPAPDPQYHCPPTFTYNGHTYVGGNSYDAVEIYYDYLNYKIDEWLRDGTSEDITTSDYYYAQIHSMALLYDFAPDAVLRNKARVFLDWLIFNYAVSFSANHPSGGHGRNYTGYEESGKDFFPWSVFFSLDQRTIDMITQQGVYTDLYVSGYRYPQVLADIFESINGPKRTEGDDYYRIIRGHIPAMGERNWWEQILPTSYRYDYITPNYNLGGAGIGTGWELNIMGSDTPFKLWINHCDAPVSDCNSLANDYGSRYLFFLGSHGYQHRNAMFVNHAGTLHQWLGGNSWDEESTESGWQFFRKGKVAVAVKIGNTCALEVCTIGVDYPSYDEFKTAVKTKAVLTSEKFVTSKGVEIYGGYVDYGSDFTRLPFDRLEVWDGHVGRNDETKFVSWDNNVMTVSRAGHTLVYDFNSWTYTVDGTSREVDFQPPAPPAKVNVRPGN